MHFKRKKFLIYPQIQIKLILLSSLISIISSFLIYASVLFIFFKMKSIGNQMNIPADHFYYQFLQKQINLVNIVFFAILPLVILITSIVTLRFSHKFVGPINKLIGHLKNINDSGKLSPIKFREDDYFKEIEAPFNELIEKHDKK